MNCTSLWEMRLGHFCVLWAIYVFCVFFLDTSSLVTLLSLLISLSFLKPLSIVFQDGIWLVFLNVVVWKRIQRRKKKNKKKRKKKKEKCQKEENKKGSHQILRSEMEGRSVGLKKKRWKKIVEWKFQKELTFRQILKTLLIFTFTYFYFIPFTFTLHYVLIKSLFDLEDCVV